MKYFIAISFALLMNSWACNAQRDPYRWPFDKYSIWNVPIHNNANYVDATIHDATNFEVDEDIIITFPKEPEMNIEINYADWSGADRCPSQGGVLFKAPIPKSFIYNSATWLGNTPNAGVAILNTDGTITQSQPFAKCYSDFATSHYVWSASGCELKGECIVGAHGGSGMSSIAGAIRVGEFTKGEIKHALKINLWGKENIYGEGNGYRWPAVKADGGYNIDGNYNEYTGTNPHVEMGSLLAIHKDVNLTSIEDNDLGITSEPGLIIARALQNYGAYLVDNTGWDCYGLITEHSPVGTVRDEFKELFGYGINNFGSLSNTPWAQDILTIFTNLYVVTNNTYETIGGGPTQEDNRRSEFASDFTESNNSAPFPSFKFSPKTGSAPLMVCFDASRTMDYDSDEILYEWNFDDGNASTELAPFHTYSEPGDYNVTLYVSDPSGAVDSLTKTVTVESNTNINIPLPNDTIWLKAGVNSKYVSLNFALDADNCPLYTNSNAISRKAIFIVSNGGCGWSTLKAYSNKKIVNADSNSGNLFANTSTTNPTTNIIFEEVGNLISMKFESTGKYVAAEDAGNGQLISNRDAASGWEVFSWGKVDMSTIVPNQVPKASFTVTPDSGSAPLTISLDASASSDVDVDDFLNYKWSFNDENYATGKKINYTFNTEGEYKVKLTVIDIENASDSDSIIINVSKSLGTSNFHIKTNWLSAYPNPANNNLIISFTNQISNNIKLEVFNVTGVNVLSKNINYLVINDHSFQLNTQELNSGIYLLKCVNGESTNCLKFNIIH